MKPACQENKTHECTRPGRFALGLATHFWLGYTRAYGSSGRRFAPSALADSCLFRNCAQREAQCPGYSFAIGRSGLEAVADVADLDFLRGITHGTGSVAE